MKYKENIESELKTKIKYFSRLGGYSSCNFKVVTNNRGLLFVKQLDEKLSKLNFLDMVSKEITLHPDILYYPPIYTNNDCFYQIFPFIKGKTLHGFEIKKEFFTQIVAQLVKIGNISTTKIHLSKSSTVYSRLNSSRKKLNNLACQIKKGSYEPKTKQILLDLINTKIFLIDALKNNELYEWLKKSHSFVHGDFHNENLLFNDERLVAVFDFELAHQGHFLEDAVNFVWFSFLNTSFSKKNITKALSFLRTYFKVKPFSNQDIKNAVQFTILRFSTSIFLETLFLEKKDPFIFTLIKRDIKKFRWLKKNHQKLIKELSITND